MTIRGTVRNGKVLLDKPRAFADGTEVEVRSVLRKSQNGASSVDPGCFSNLAADKALSAKDKKALRAMLTASQFEALMDIAEQGGPNIDAIAKIRSASMT